MMKFIGAQVYQHQDNVIVEMGLPTVESHNPSPIIPSTSNFTLVENGSLLELVTDPNSAIRIQRGDSGWSFTANEQGRTNISQLDSGLYQISINESEPEPVVLAKAEEYNWMSYQYYTPDNYIIRVDGNYIAGYSDKLVGLYDAEGNELYRTLVNRDINHVDITYTMEDSPGLLEPGQYRITMQSVTQDFILDEDFTLEFDSNTDILSFRYNNYLDYNIRIGAPRGSQVHLQGPITLVYDIDESFDVRLVSEGWGPDLLLPGSYTVAHIFNGVSSNPVNLDLVDRPFQDVKLEYVEYYPGYEVDSYYIGLSGEPFSRVVVGGVEYPEPISASGFIEISSHFLDLRLVRHEIYEIYIYNRDWKSNTIQVEIP